MPSGILFTTVCTAWVLIRAFRASVRAVSSCSPRVQLSVFSAAGSAFSSTSAYSAGLLSTLSPAFSTVFPLTLPVCCVTVVAGVPSGLLPVRCIAVSLVGLSGVPERLLSPVSADLAPEPRESPVEGSATTFRALSPGLATAFTGDRRTSAIGIAEGSALNVSDVSLGSATASIEGCRTFAISFSGTPTDDKYSETIKFLLFLASVTASTMMWEPSIFFSKITIGAFFRLAV